MSNNTIQTHGGGHNSGALSPHFPVHAKVRVLKLNIVSFSHLDKTREVPKLTSIRVLQRTRDAHAETLLKNPNAASRQKVSHTDSFQIPPRQVRTPPGLFKRAQGATTPWPLLTLTKGNTRSGHVDRNYQSHSDRHAHNLLITRFAQIIVTIIFDVTCQSVEANRAHSSSPSA